MKSLCSNTIYCKSAYINSWFKKMHFFLSLQTSSLRSTKTAVKKNNTRKPESLNYVHVEFALPQVRSEEDLKDVEIKEVAPTEICRENSETNVKDKEKVT